VLALLGPRSITRAVVASLNRPRVEGKNP